MPVSKKRRKSGNVKTGKANRFGFHGRIESAEPNLLTELLPDMGEFHTNDDLRAKGDLIYFSINPEVLCGGTGMAFEETHKGDKFINMGFSLDYNGTRYMCTVLYPKRFFAVKVLYEFTARLTPEDRYFTASGEWVTPYHFVCEGVHKDCKMRIVVI